MRCAQLVAFAQLVPFPQFGRLLPARAVLSATHLTAIALARCWPDASPELFVANGSHGIWGGAGRFEYARTPRLFDATSRGFGWRTWLNLVMVDATAASFASFAGTDLQWLNFNGRWGNDDELACESYLWYGRFCGVERAPFGPGVYDASGAGFNWKTFWLQKPLEKSLELKPFLELLFVPIELKREF